MLAVMPEQIDGISSIIVLSFAALAVVCLQFFCCWKWDNFFIRIIPTAVTFVCSVVFFVMMSRAATSDLRDAYCCGLIISAMMLGATALGWISWLVYCFAHGRIRLNPAGY